MTEVGQASSAGSELVGNPEPNAFVAGSSPHDGWTVSGPAGPPSAVRSSPTCFLDEPHPGPAGPVGANRSVVCVVGDVPSERDFLSAVVTRMGLTPAAYASGEAFLADRPFDALCVLCDLGLSGLGGLDVQARLREAAPGLPVVFLSGTESVADAVRAMRGGAVTLLRKPCGPDEVRAAISEAAAIGQDRRRRLRRRRDVAARFAALSAEELAVLEGLMDGTPNKAVAARLGLGLRTVERRRAAALRTLDVESIVAAALLRAELNEAARPSAGYGLLN